MEHTPNAPALTGLARVGATARRISRVLADLLWPEPCAACGVMLAAAPAVPGREGGLPPALAPLASCLCPQCLSLCHPIAVPLCPLCGLPYAPEAVGHECSWCRDRRPRFVSARAAGVYGGPLRLAIHRFKYSRRSGLARPMSRSLAQAFLAFYGPEGADVAVPVPLHIGRLRHRGFNQALLLLGGFGPEHGLPPVAPRALVRTRNTPPQVGLSARERTVNLKNAFAVSDPAAVRDLRVLLVDDVYTTGATAEACSRELLKAGALEVKVLTLARVM
ncbi:MAG: ComF family protein [Proteobacteria bacterium]|nr:ComF family protein [Pseudomonadota bacterium]